MKNINSRRLAPVGLYIALLAAITSIGLYIIYRQWNLPLQISLGLIIIGLALFVILDPQKTRELLTGRQARYGSNVFVMTVAFLGILLVVNFVAYKNPKRVDLTEEKQHTLLPETLQTLEELPQPVKAIAFYPVGAPTDQAKQLLEDYKYYSNGKFDYEFIDPEQDPVAAKQANVPLGSSGTIIVTLGDRKEKLALASEQELTSALVKLISQKDVTVYFLTGHGEYSSTGTGDTSYSDAKSTLESKGYVVKELNLLATNEIPQDARVIVIAGPRKPVSANEVQLIKDYQAKGGGLIVMEEPAIFTDYGSDPDPLAEYLVKQWGIYDGQDVVLDMTSQQPYQVYAYRYDQHPITEKLLDQNLGSAFPSARSVEARDTITDVTTTQLIYTAPRSWAETDLEGIKNNQQPNPDQGVDMIGNVPIAATAENTSTNARMVSFGDSDFAINVNFLFLGNGDLFVNSVDWVAAQENLINLTPRQPVQRIMMPPTQVTVGLILFGSIFVIPGLVIVAGITVWILRRRRG